MNPVSPSPPVAFSSHPAARDPETIPRPFAALFAVLALVLLGAHAWLVVRAFTGGDIGSGGLGNDFALFLRIAGSAHPYAGASASFARSGADALRAPAFSPYPPLMGLLLRPFVALSFAAALAIWLLFGAGCLAAAWWWTCAAWRLAARRRLIALFALAAAPSTWWAFQQGQLNVVLLGLMAGALFAVARGRWSVAGAAVGAAAAVKGYPALLVLPLVTTRQWRGVLWFAAAALSLTVLGALAVPDGWRYFTDVLPHQGSASPSFDNYGLPGVAARLLSPNAHHSELIASPALALVVGRILPAAMVVAILYVTRRHSNPVLSGMLALLPALPLVITTSWESSAILAGPAFWLLAAVALGSGAGPGTKLAALIATVLGVISPTVRYAHYGGQELVRAILSHDRVFLLWGLDLTVAALAVLIGVLLWSGDQPVREPALTQA